MHYMKKQVRTIFIFNLLVIQIFLFSCSKDGGTATNNNGTSGNSNGTGNNTTTGSSSKKGIGLSEKNGFNNTQLQLLNVSWNYNWGLTTAANSTVSFIPMEWGTGGLSSLGTYSNLLGFNEPDNSSQSNLTVAQAIGNWPALVSAAGKIGSPSMAGNPVTTGSWLQQFMQTTQAPKVDFITVHWYKGVDTAKFYSDMTAIYTLFNLPIWVTEFAPQTASQSSSNPSQYSQDQVNQFISATTNWMNKQTFIQRYAWHDSQAGTSAIFTTSGQLTATGSTYASVK